MLYPILTTTALLSVWGAAAYMSVCGLAAVFGAHPVVIMAAAGMELGKLMLIIHLHRKWHALRLVGRAFYVVVITALVTLTAVEVAGYLIGKHQQDTANIAVAGAHLDGLVAEEADLRNRIQGIDATLDQLPEGYVTRRLNERNALGYGHLQEQLATNLDTQKRLRVELADARSASGPIVALSEITGADPSKVLLIFVVVLVGIMEPLSVGLAVAASIAWTRPATVPIAPAAPAAGQAAEAHQAATPGQRPPEAATVAATVATENGHAATPTNKEFAAIVERHTLKKEDIARITGRKQTSTVEAWLCGQQEIPVKALRLLRRWAAGRPPIRLVQKAAKGAH